MKNLTHACVMGSEVDFSKRAVFLNISYVAHDIAIPKVDDKCRNRERGVVAIGASKSRLVFETFMPIIPAIRLEMILETLTPGSRNEERVSSTISG